MRVCVYSKMNFDNVIERTSLNEINGALLDCSLSSTPGAQVSSLSSGNGLSIALDFARRKKKSFGGMLLFCSQVSVNEPDVDCKESSKELSSLHFDSR